MDSTAYALQVLNDTDYGAETDYTNGLITSEWGEKEEREFCTDYLEFIIGINGTGELMKWERDMAKHFNYNLEEE